MPTVDERARSMLLAALEREGWKPFPISRFWTSGSGRASLAALATAIIQLDEARAVALEEAARVAEKRAEERFAELGTREPDTNATYYEGRQGEWLEALDEEDLGFIPFEHVCSERS